MLIGQNGIVIIVGAVEDSMKAASAVKLVEDEAHSADLTEKVQSMLGLTVAQKQELNGEPQPASDAPQTPEQGSENLEQAEQVFSEEEESEEQ